MRDATRADRGGLTLVFDRTRDSGAGVPAHPRGPRPTLSAAAEPAGRDHPDVAAAGLGLLPFPLSLGEVLGAARDPLEAAHLHSLTQVWVTLADLLRRAGTAPATATPVAHGAARARGAVTLVPA